MMEEPKEVPYEPEYKRIDFFKLALPVKSLALYNQDVDYKAELPATQDRLGHRLGIFKAIGKIVVDTDNDAVKALWSDDYKVRARFRNMVHRSSRADSDRNENVAAHLACDCLYFATAPYDNNARMHHPNFGEAISIAPSLRDHWKRYIHWDEIWNEFRIDYSSTVLSPRHLSTVVDHSSITNGLPLEQANVTIGDHTTIRHLVEGGLRASKTSKAGAIEDNFIKAALVLHALVIVSLHLAPRNESDSLYIW
jgi:hypothetical protein